MRYPADSRDQMDNLPDAQLQLHRAGRGAAAAREELRSRSRAVVLQTAGLRGLGGVGKTQVALEYAHRFKDDYDIVWWLNCDPPQYIDASLVDLGSGCGMCSGQACPRRAA